ncbi:hypothetical protein [Winogradskyella sp.]|jgi:hypothetical protein|uniref:hypothetical protein n=1 Tax=Winogradskyella sp. TaxID=1883156 RepID=UPI0025CF97DA|nr:hypothetical protein [Winogradskyella sp.]MCT4629339.1 hypothetical protein [Winogradskyella sp.]
MIVFFGLRSARIESRKVNANTTCEHCNNENTFIASLYGNYFHVFWIPIVSTGKAIVVECAHCKKTYHLQDLSSENQMAIQNVFVENPPKKARWLNLGCFVLVAVTILFVCLTIYGIIYAKTYEDSYNDYDYQQDETMGESSEDSNSDYYYEPEIPKPRWVKALKKDLLNSELYPTEENEPISYALYQCLDPETLKLGKEDVGYFYRIKGDKILILLEAWNLRKLSDKEKNKVYSKIDICLDDILKNDNYKRYIGVYDEDELKMQKTPKGMVKDSTAKTSELLKEFYD